VFRAENLGRADQARSFKALSNLSAPFLSPVCHPSQQAALVPKLAEWPFVPITVVKNRTVDVALYSKDNVWQLAFLKGT
jgi:hypothetical protein